ncbi:MAG: hypothetical protein ABWZ15_17655, partial [Acidimicrobiia bacterium]
MSGDARYVAFDSAAPQVVAGDGNGASDVFVRDLVANKNILISKNDQGTQAAGISTDPVISRNGRFVAFLSTASIDDGVNASVPGGCDPPGPDEYDTYGSNEVKDKNGTLADVYVHDRD